MRADLDILVIALYRAGCALLLPSERRDTAVGTDQRNELLALMVAQMLCWAKSCRNCRGST